jgi:release factor glutamine methyltransferase
MSPVALVLAGREPAPPAVVAQLRRLVARRLAGEPLAYVLGRWGFRRLELEVDRRVLVPRPETEQVVEAAVEALAVLRRREDRADAALSAADLGTGSGAIALSLALEVPGLEVFATDRSRGALEVAAANRGRLPEEAASRVHLQAGDFYEALPPRLRGRLALVVANPPYVAEGEFAGLPAEVRDFEPPEALVAGPTGLEAVAAVVRQAGAWLRPGGALVVEIAPHQASPAAVLARRAGLAEVSVRTDLAGRERVLVATRPRVGGGRGPDGRAGGPR